MGLLEGWIKTFKGFSDAVKGVASGAGKVAGVAGVVVTAPVALGTRGVFKAGRAALNGAGHVTSGVLGSTVGFFRSPIGKIIGLGTLAVGALATYGIMRGKSKGEDRREQMDAEMNAMLAPAPQLEAPAVANVQQPAATIAGPTDNTYWQNRVRGMQPTAAAAEQQPPVNTRA